jgi:manganese oxidase
MEPPRARPQGGQSMPRSKQGADIEVQIRKPGGHSGH